MPLKGSPQLYICSTLLDFQFRLFSRSWHETQLHLPYAIPISNGKSRFFSKTSLLVQKPIPVPQGARVLCSILLESSCFLRNFFQKTAESLQRGRRYRQPFNKGFRLMLTHPFGRRVQDTQRHGGGLGHFILSGRLGGYCHRVALRHRPGDCPKANPCRQAVPVASLPM